MAAGDDAVRTEQQVEELRAMRIAVVNSLAEPSEREQTGRPQAPRPPAQSTPVRTTAISRIMMVSFLLSIISRIIRRDGGIDSGRRSSWARSCRALVECRSLGAGSVKISSRR
jgi:hypothetical protein